MNQAILDEVISHPDSALMRFTVDQYQRLLEDGVLTEGAPFELLDGYIFHKNRADLGADEMTHSPRHAQRLARLTPILNEASNRLGVELYCQLPLQITPHSAPEPDFSLVIPPSSEEDRHPGPQEVCLVIEVALSSLKRDRRVKLPIYARSGIQEYWLINLPEQQVEVYRLPDQSTGKYTFELIAKAGDIVTLTGPNGASVSFDAESLLR